MEIAQTTDKFFLNGIFTWYKASTLQLSIYVWYKIHPRTRKQNHTHPCSFGAPRSHEYSWFFQRIFLHSFKCNGMRWHRLFYSSPTSVLTNENAAKKRHRKDTVRTAKQNWLSTPVRYAGEDFASRGYDVYLVHARCCVPFGQAGCD